MASIPARIAALSFAFRAAFVWLEAITNLSSFVLATALAAASLPGMLATSLALTAVCSSRIAFCAPLEMSNLRPVVEVGPEPGMVCGRASPEVVFPCGWGGGAGMPYCAAAGAEMAIPASAIASALIDVFIVLLSRPNGSGQSARQENARRAINLL